MEKKKFGLTRQITEELIFILKYGKITENELDYLCDLAQNSKQISYGLYNFCETSLFPLCGDLCVEEDGKRLEKVFRKNDKKIEKFRNIFNENFPIINKVLEFNKNFHKDKSENSKENYVKWWLILLKYFNINNTIKKYQSLINFRIFFHLLFKEKNAEIKTNVLYIIETLRDNFINNNEFDKDKLLKEELNTFFSDENDLFENLKNQTDSKENAFVFQSLNFPKLLFNDQTDPNYKKQLKLNHNSRNYVDKIMKLTQSKQYNKKVLGKLIKVFDKERSNKNFKINPEECLLCYLFFYIIKWKSLLNDESQILKKTQYEKIIDLIEFTLFGEYSNLRQFNFPEEFQIEPIEYVSGQKNIYFLLCLILYFSQNLKSFKLKEDKVLDKISRCKNDKIDIFKYLDLIPFENIKQQNNLKIKKGLRILIDVIFKQVHSSYFTSRNNNSKLIINFIEKLFMCGDLLNDSQTLEKLTELFVEEKSKGILFLIFGHFIKILNEQTLIKIFAQKHIYSNKKITEIWDLSRAYFLISYWLFQCEKGNYHTNKYHRILFLINFGESRKNQPNNFSVPSNDLNIISQNPINSKNFNEALTNLKFRHIKYSETLVQKDLKYVNKTTKGYNAIIIGPLKNPSEYSDNSIQYPDNFDVKPIFLCSSKDDTIFTISENPQINIIEKEELLNESYLLFINPESRIIYNVLQILINLSKEIDAFKSLFLNAFDFLSLLNKPPEIEQLMKNIIKNHK